MKITEEFLKEKRACTEGFNWAKANNCIGLEAIELLNKLVIEDKLDWANWLIVRVMERKQYLAYTIFADEQVINIYEKRYPENKKPRLAIEDAKKVLKNDTKDNRFDAYDADVAYVAAAAAYAAAAARKEIKIKIFKYGISLLEAE